MKFHSYKAFLGIYIDYWWNIWEDTIKRLKKYTYYAIKNILQIKKSQLDIKLDRDLRNAINNHQVVDAKIFDNENNNTNDRKKKGKEEPEDNINMPTTDFYSYIVAITQMR